MMWSHQVRSLLGKPPAQPQFMKGGKGVISFAAREAAIISRKAKRHAVEEQIVQLVSDGAWWKIYEVALAIEKDRAHLTRVLKDLVKDGRLEGVQSRGERREWYFRKAQK